MMTTDYIIIIIRTCH